VGFTNHKSKRDTNHTLITTYLLQLGFSVYDTSTLGSGFPDIIIARNKETAIAEIKTEKGKLSQGQVDFISSWQGKVFILRNIEDCVELANKWG